MPSPILWDCLRFHLGRLPVADEERLNRQISGHTWEREAALQGMGGLVEAAALRLGQEIVPYTLRSQARVNAAYEMECLHLSEVFGRRGIPVMALKGGALLFSIYSQRSGWRPLRDLDLMVEAARKEEAIALLHLQGYRPSAGGYARLGLELDLHCDLWGSERIPQRKRVWGLPPEEVWRTSQPLCQGSWMRKLAPAHQFQHLLVHALKHSYRRLIWLADLAFLAETHPATKRPSAALEVAEGVAERLLYNPLGGPSPGLKIPWLAERLVDRIRQGRAPEFAGEVVIALLQPSWKDRVSYLTDLLLPPESELGRLYPSTPRPLLRWRRLLALLCRLWNQPESAK